MTERSVGNAIAEAGTLAGNVYDKYGSTNPIARRLMAGFLGAFDDLVRRTGARDGYEVGCGEGQLAVRLAALGLDVRASDIAPSIVDSARRRASEHGAAVAFETASVHDLSAPRDAAELVVCCEVLEHLEAPERALETLCAVASPWLLASVPREPLWCLANLARGKYLRRLGNTPGHLNHWSRRSFLRFLGRRTQIVDYRLPFPWTMVLCHTRARHLNDVPPPIVGAQ